MSLTRRVGLLLAAMLLLVLLVSAGVHLLSVRHAIQTRLQTENRHAAALLAVMVARRQGDSASLGPLLNALFDSGAYQHIRFDTAADGVVFDRTAEQTAQAAPAWFVRWAAIAAAPGLAQVAEGGQMRGTLEVAGSLVSAQDELWRDALRTAAALGSLFGLAGLLGTLALMRIRRPLAAAVGQAQALLKGSFVGLPVPSPHEPRLLSQAMNAMVAHLKASFDAQAAQLELLRQQAHCDPLTGLSSRSHFLDQLEASLEREDGADRFGLVLLRLCDLASLNRELGHAAADRLLGAIAEALRPYAERVPGCLLGRLNGADFALCLPVGGVALETAQALAGALRAVLPTARHGATVALGAVELRRETSPSDALTAADEALVRAEARGGYAVEFGGGSPGAASGEDEPAWRHGIDDALAYERARLMAFPVVDEAGELVHIECPLRLQLRAGGEFDIAARWLPLAVRGRMTSAIDLRAVALALAAIADDGRPRCVSLAAASLADSNFVARLRALLVAAPRAAGSLSVELAESVAIERFALLRELIRQLGPCGVTVGLRHAGARLGRIERLFSLGLDFVKLDTAVVRGVGNDARRRSFVHGTVELLHGLSLQVFAEGVSDDDDAQALWACGVDAITGPWAGARLGMAAVH